MGKALKAVGAGLLFVIIAALIPGAAGPAMNLGVAPPAPLRVPQAVKDAIRSAEAAGQPFVQVDLAVDSPTDLAGLRTAVLKAGGKVTGQEPNHVLAELPPGAVETLAAAQRVTAVGINQELSVATAHPATLHDIVATGDAADLEAANMDAIDVNAFRSETNATGEGVTVAIIDTGVDPDHPALRQTAGGQPKIVDWKDFTSEGLMKINEAVAWDGPFTASDGRRFTLPDKPVPSAHARFGYLDEFPIWGTYLNRDLDQNGSQTDRFGVLLVDSSGSGNYDTVYIDTNDNGDFTDEVPLTVFRQGHAVAKMGRIRSGSHGQERLNIVAADIDPAGNWVSLGFDGYGHGTEVAGVLGGNDPQTGFTGVAPGVQIMALKAMDSSGTGSWLDTIRPAIQYAATHGANIINLSIGGLTSADSEFDSSASEWLNQISRQYGVLIVLATGNTGPGLTSGTTLGSPSEVMMVGAYYSSAMWKRDFGFTVPHESIWAWSGMGPGADGSSLPNVVAPGGSPTTAPLWLHATGYATEVGTSIAAPHVSGAAALLMAAGKAGGFRYDRMSVKRALEMGARHIANFDVYEQGNGVVELRAAYNHLKQINSVPALKARSGEDNGGILARSYAPGSDSFWLSNLGSAISRVSIYSSEAWVRPLFRSMLIPPDAPRQLPLEMTPPSDPGVHSAFLLLTNPDKYGTSLRVPVTYVKPIDLAPGLENTYAQSDQLEVGRYRRYFFQVKPGTPQLAVTVRVPLVGSNAQSGTATVNVFRPDGKMIYASDIGAKGSSLTALMRTADPVDGVWEVVVTATPTAASGPTVNYSLEAYTLPSAIADQPLRFTVPAGRTTSVPIKLTNIYGPFKGQVKAFGLTPLDPNGDANIGQPWRVVHQSASRIDEFDLASFTANLRIEISNTTPVTTPVTLSLYYLDKADYKLWGQAVTSKEDGRAVIDLTNLPPGHYQTLAVTDNGNTASVRYQYRRLQANQAYQVTADDTEQTHKPGDNWTVNLAIWAPTVPGRYVGQVMLWDADTQSALGWFPFEVSVGEPALSVEPMVAELTAGQPGNVVLQLRDVQGAIVGGTVTVNGERFVSRNGQVHVPVRPDGDTQVLNIEADIPGYQFLTQRTVLPVRDSWGLHPFGLSVNGETTTWHQKLMNEMP